MTDTKPLGITDPPYPTTGAEWEERIWNTLKEHPFQSANKLREQQPSLSLGSISGMLSKLEKRGQVVSVKFLNPKTSREVAHYSVAGPTYTPAVRVRKGRVKKAIPAFDFTQENPPEKLITQTSRIQASLAPVTIDSKADDMVDSMGLLLGRAVYDRLHAIFSGVKK